MEPILNQLTAWAKTAGSIVREGYGKTHQVKLKGRIDPVTEVDHLSEEYLLKQIQNHFPNHTIETEESGLLSGEKTSRWYIDPLDGTTNYAHHLPVFSVSVAYAVEGKVQLGVVYDPMRDECFSAERGRGAWLNGEPIHVSATADLLHSLLVTGFPYRRYADHRNNLAAFVHFNEISQGVRRLGSAALDVCYVAAGRFEGYWEQTIRAYDIAAGALIVEEAGGVVTKLNGSADYLKAPFTLLAGNPAVHALMLQEFHKIQ
jgi:myo-inositol-1(or 4)-monophosphatase